MPLACGPLHGARHAGERGELMGASGADASIASGRVAGWASRRRSRPAAWLAVRAFGRVARCVLRRKTTCNTAAFGADEAVA